MGEKNLAEAAERAVSADRGTATCSNFRQVFFTLFVYIRIPDFNLNLLMYGKLVIDWTKIKTKNLAKHFNKKIEPR